MRIAFIVTFFVVSFLVLDQALVRANTNNGIHPIGREAVYLEGEACTINMPLDAEAQDLIPLFNKCLSLHNEVRQSK